MLNDILKLIDSKEKYIIKLSATWCAPCKAMDRIIQKIIQDNDHLMGKFIDVDIDDEPEVAGHFGIMSVPTFLYVSDGMYKMRVGTQSASDLVDWFK